jgi:lipoate-protein ligase A
MKQWRLLDIGPMTAAENMALDDTLLELKGKGDSIDTLRFLQFSPPAVLIGFHQSVEEEVRLSYCRDKGIDINRRITGGGAIFFDENQLGWEVICDKKFFNIEIPNQWLFRTLCDPVIEALDRFGLQASFRPRNDIEINGRKISGTGGTESDGAFLFQGTMLVDFDVEGMIRSLKIPVEKLKAKEINSIKERVTCLKEEIGDTPPLDEIKGAIKYGFESCLNIRLESAGLNKNEERLFQKKLKYYSSREWIDLVKPKHSKSRAIQAANKVEGGLIRYTLIIDQVRNRVKDLYITGDFLSFPSRALFDLESRLRGMPIDRERLNEVIYNFFKKGRIQIPGINQEDFIKPLELAIEKFAITNHNISLEHCNDISVIGGSFDEIIEMRPSVLLLPYCSKDVDCDLRYEKGCRVCGGCSIGNAWEMGIENNMDVRSVNSFEDLMRELERMENQGDKAFIGCCCQPFFTKHVQDFEKMGVPGILLNIDNTTCYELDQAREAYAGEFASQTSLNLDLLGKVLGVISDYHDTIKIRVQ